MPYKSHLRQVYKYNSVNKNTHIYFQEWEYWHHIFYLYTGNFVIKALSDKFICKGKTTTVTSLNIGTEVPANSVESDQTTLIGAV